MKIKTGSGMQTETQTRTYRLDNRAKERLTVTDAHDGLERQRMKHKNEKVGTGTGDETNT